MADEIMFSDAIVKHYIPLLQYATRLLKGRKELAEDLIQNTWLHAKKKDQALSSNAGYIFAHTALRNLFIMDVRKKMNIQYHGIDHEPLTDWALGLWYNTEASIEIENQMNIVMQAIEMLSPVQRYTVLESFKDNMLTHSARRLRINENTFKRNYLFAVNNLKEMLCTLPS